MATDDTGNEPGTGTPPEKAAKYTDDDMARLRRSYDAKIDKAKETASQAALRTALDELGVADLDDLRDRLKGAESLQTAETAAQTELKKFQRELAKVQKERDDALAERAKAAKEREQLAIKDSIFAVAKEVGAHEDLVYAVARDRVVMDGEEIAGPDGQTVGEYIKTLVEKDPRLLANPSGAGSLPAGTNGAPSGPDLRTVEGMSQALDAAGYTFKR